MKLKDLMEKYGEYEVDLKKVVGDCEIESVVIDLTKPKPKSVWDLEIRDIYYDLHSDGQIHPLRYEGKESDTKRILTGSAFLNKEEAEQDLERRRVEALLLRFGGRRWFKRGSANYFLEFYGESLKADYTNSSNFAWQGLIYFDTKAQIENAIQNIGADRIKRALFEVR